MSARVDREKCQWRPKIFPERGGLFLVFFGIVVYIGYKDFDYKNS